MVSKVILRPAQVCKNCATGVCNRRFPVGKAIQEPMPSECCFHRTWRSRYFRPGCQLFRQRHFVVAVFVVAVSIGEKESLFTVIAALATLQDQTEFDRVPTALSQRSEQPVYARNGGFIPSSVIGISSSRRKGSVPPTRSTEAPRRRLILNTGHSQLVIEWH